MATASEGGPPVGVGHRLRVHGRARLGTMGLVALSTTDVALIGAALTALVGIAAFLVNRRTSLDVLSRTLENQRTMARDAQSFQERLQRDTQQHQLQLSRENPAAQERSEQLRRGAARREARVRSIEIFIGEHTAGAGLIVEWIRTRNAERGMVALTTAQERAMGLDRIPPAVLQANSRMNAAWSVWRVKEMTFRQWAQNALRELRLQDPYEVDYAAYYDLLVAGAAVESAIEAYVDGGDVLDATAAHPPLPRTLP